MADLPKKSESGIITSTDRIAPNSSRNNLTLYADKDATKAGLVLDKESGKASFPGGIYIPNELSEYVDSSVKNNMPPFSWGSWDVKIIRKQPSLQELEFVQANYTKIGPMVNVLINCKVGIRKGSITGLMRFSLPFKVVGIGVMDLVIPPGYARDGHDTTRDLPASSNGEAETGLTIATDDDNDSSRDPDGVLRFNFQIRAFYQTEE
ncbi:MAG: hypothetical protein AB8G05_27575 [Oligoflexales bacterium]